MKHLLLVAIVVGSVAAGSHKYIGNSRRELIESSELNEEELNLIINKSAKPGFEPGKY
jgi:hypothetical protein